MRHGQNPARDNAKLVEGYSNHRIIIPVYIPSLEGYFREMKTIVRCCLDSLIVTTRGAIPTTVVSNNCCAEIIEQLQDYRTRNEIDQLILNGKNHGKVNAVLSVARGCHEDLLSVADCDVLFREGWLEAMTNLFRSFPECGYAAMSPNPKHAWHDTSATILGGLARGELRFGKFVSDEDLDQFATSIGNPQFYGSRDRDAQLVVQRKGSIACVGGGHYAFSIRREVLAATPTEPIMSFRAAEKLYLDQPPDNLGAWRLSAPATQAWHMGNVPEPWMHQALANQRQAATICPQNMQTAPVPKLRKDLAARVSPSIRRILVRMIRRSGIVTRMSPPTRRVTTTQVAS